MSTSPRSESSSQQSRKKQKVDTEEFQRQIDELQREIAAVKKRLSSMDQSTNPAHAIGKKCIEMKQRATLLKQKLAEHSNWMQQISSLVEAAPLLGVAVLVDTKQHQVAGKTKPRLSSHLPDGWAQPSHNQYQAILEQRLRDVVAKSQQNVAEMLQKASSNAPPFHFPLRFESRGWRVAAGAIMNKQVGFSCSRRLPSASTSTAIDVATVLWEFVQRDEVLRTFVPLVVDSMVAFQKDDISLSRRVVQLGPEGLQQKMVTVESITSSHGKDEQESAWQVSVETVHDPYLCAFVAEAFREPAASGSAPHVNRELGMLNKFACCAHASKSRDGIDILMVGSARCDLSGCNNPAFDLLQHIVRHAPVYEDIHLGSLRASSSSKAAATTMQ